MKEKLAKRIAEIEQALKNKEAELVQLLGHLNEAKFMLETIFKEECEANSSQSTETVGG